MYKLGVPVSFNDAKVGRVLFADYNPVKKPEFNGNHLSIILKKNIDNSTVIVLPLTKVASHNPNSSKKLLGTISSLPAGLSKNESYYVYDQVRTLNVNRLSHILDNGKPIEVFVGEEKLKEVLQDCVKELDYALSVEEKDEHYYKLFIYARTRYIISKAYEIKSALSNEATKDSVPDLIEDLKKLEYDKYFSNTHMNEHDHKIKINEFIKDCLEGNLLPIS